MNKKYLPLLPILLLLAVLLSLWLYPSSALWLWMASLLSSLALGIHAIFENHKGAGNPRAGILKDTLLLTLSLLLIIFLGGLAGMFANYHASLLLGNTAGLLVAVAASFLAGYLVRMGISGLRRYVNPRAGR